MNYRLHNVKCTDCGTVTTVGTDEEDTISDYLVFEYECPSCNHDIEFNPGNTVASPRLPIGAVRGYLVGDEDDED